MPHLATPALHEAAVRAQLHPLPVPRALPRVWTVSLWKPRKSKATGGDESIFVILHLIYVILFLNHLICPSIMDIQAKGKLLLRFKIRRVKP
jgi:hypothetical protein